MPEILNDEFFCAIKECVKVFKSKTILEIGSWDGKGSTQSFIQSIVENKLSSQLYCLEAQKDRYEQLVNNMKSFSFVKCYNRLSGTIKDLRSEQDIRDFIKKYPALLISQNPVEKVLGWRKQEDTWPLGVLDNGIEIIKKENNIKNFDMVLIDGSEFTGVRDFELTIDSDVFLLDDINAMKNYENYLTLKNDKKYFLVKSNWHLRNGYAIFKRK
jgi:hypothetical protein